MSSAAAESSKAAPQEHRPGLGFRLRVAAGLLTGLRVHDFRAARTFINTMFPGQPLPRRLLGFVKWTLRQMFLDIPEAMTDVTFAKPVSRTPFWLTSPNPWANHPWSTNPQASLAGSAHTVVIGAGFTGAPFAYHWSKRAPAERLLVVLDMDDPASGASGRNEGAVVMGRYFAVVRDTVKRRLPRVRPDLDEAQREALARRFAAAYCRAGYRSAELIAQTIAEEKFDCDYHRGGWVQAKEAEHQAHLEESIRLAQEIGCTDWSKITPEEVLERSGMRVRYPAGFSKGCASWDPAKWVWCLLTAALRHPTAQLFTRTRVLRVEDGGEQYLVHTTRGTIRARHVVNATESYTAMLHPRFKPVLGVMQTQAAVGDGGPTTMKPHVVISGTKAFWERHGSRTLFGSDSTRIPHRAAGQNKPSRFISKFFLGHMKQLYGPYQMQVTHEWSGSVGITPDEYPIVGVFDGKRQYIIAGMVGSGSNVSFNAARCVAARILGTGEPDDYPPEFFAPSRVLDPAHHQWPDPEAPLAGPPENWKNG